MHVDLENPSCRHMMTANGMIRLLVRSFLSFIAYCTWCSGFLAGIMHRQELSSYCQNISTFLVVTSAICLIYRITTPISPSCSSDACPKKISKEDGGSCSFTCFRTMVIWLSILSLVYGSKMLFEVKEPVCSGDLEFFSLGFTLLSWFLLLFESYFYVLRIFSAECNFLSH